MERTPRMNASVEVDGAGGVATGGATKVVATGVDAVALVSVTGTVADLCALGTLWKASVVAFPLLSSASSWSCSTTVCISLTFKSRS